MKSWFLIALLGAALLFDLAHAGSPLLDVRQVVIRAPELEVIQLLTGPPLSDGAFLDELWTRAAAGRARVVSDVRISGSHDEPIVASVGRRFRVPIEADQDIYRLFLTPVDTAESLTGTLLLFQPHSHDLGLGGGEGSAGWSTSFSERDPIPVKWPVSWLEQRVAVHGRMDWYDAFRENLRATVISGDGTPRLLGILPAATQGWEEKPGVPKFLDVVEARVQGGPLPARPQATPPATDPQAFPSTRTVWLGISVPSNQALAWLAADSARDDETFLNSLLLQVKANTARVRFCLASSSHAGHGIQFESGRFHNYPTEMPSIPSAWNERLVGTSMSMESQSPWEVQLELEHHLAPPRRTEWPLGLGEPWLVMWEPAFRTFRAAFSPMLPGRGTRLLCFMKLPQVMLGEGVNEEETLVVFSRQAGDPLPALEKPAPPAPPSDPFAPEANAVQVPRGISIETEIFVFEVPKAEANQWQPSPADQWNEPDTNRFQKLLDRTRKGEVPLVAQAQVRSLPGCRSNLSMVEEIMTATEFDPPTEEGPHRIRPTALETLPIGTRWEVETTAGVSQTESGGFQISLTHTLNHSTGRPVEPALKDTIQAAGPTGNGPYPTAVVFEEEWHGQHYLTPGIPLCLGTREPPGLEEKQVVHVAFLRTKVIRLAP